MNSEQYKVTFIKVKSMFSPFIESRRSTYVFALSGISSSNVSINISVVFCSSSNVVVPTIIFKLNYILYLDKYYKFHKVKFYVRNITNTSFIIIKPLAACS